MENGQVCGTRKTLLDDVSWELLGYTIAEFEAPSIDRARLEFMSGIVLTQEGDLIFRRFAAPLAASARKTAVWLIALVALLEAATAAVAIAGLRRARGGAVTPSGEVAGAAG